MFKEVKAFEAVDDDLWQDRSGPMRTLKHEDSTGILPAILVVLACTTVAPANPCGAAPTELAGWVVVVGASLLLEVFITTGFLLFSGIAVVPMFFALVLGNTVSYVGILLPLYEATKTVWLVEVVIVAAEAALVKGLSHLPLFQGDTFDGLKWRSAFLSVLAGNACSYYIGTLLASSQGA